jgi:sulfur carrier protein
MNVRVNGRDLNVDEDITLDRLVALVGHDPGVPGMAAAVNDEVVPRSTWQGHNLAPGDRVELLAAAQGG